MVADAAHLLRVGLGIILCGKHETVKEGVYGRGAGRVSEIASRGGDIRVEQRDLRSARSVRTNRGDTRSYREDATDATRESGVTEIPSICVW